MEPPVEIEYQGVVYKRNPDSVEWPKRVYYLAPRKSGRGYLHRDIYADALGPIPRGMHIHHQDHDPFNNDPSNLVALTPGDHQRLHRERNGKFDAERMRIHRETTLVAAAEWHRSEAGREFHREIARKSWENPQTGVFTCPECGVEHTGFFPTRGNTTERYCSGRCRQRADKRAGKYTEEATCPVCKETYTRPKMKGRYLTCSRRCSAKRRWAREREAGATSES